MIERTIEKSVYLQSTAEAVWAYLTQPDKLAVWLHRPNTALTEGVEFSMTDACSDGLVMSGEVLKAEPFHTLEYTFHIAPMGDTVSTVRWHIEEVPGGVRLSLVHSGLPQAAEAFGLLLALDKGWEEHVARMRADLPAG